MIELLHDLDTPQFTVLNSSLTCFNRTDATSMLLVFCCNSLVQHMANHTGTIPTSCDH